MALKKYKYERCKYAVVEIKGLAVWRWKVGPTGGIVATCDALNLTAQSEHPSDAHAAMQDGMHVLFTDLHEAGELAGFLMQQGWARMTDPMPSPFRNKHIVFDLPIAIIYERGFPKTPGRPGRGRRIVNAAAARKKSPRSRAPRRARKK